VQRELRERAARLAQAQQRPREPVGDPVSDGPDLCAAARTAAAAAREELKQRAVRRLVVLDDLHGEPRELERVRDLEVEARLQRELARRGARAELLEPVRVPHARLRHALAQQPVEPLQQRGGRENVPPVKQRDVLRVDGRLAAQAAWSPTKMTQRA
jgi:hypothetical protein